MKIVLASNHELRYKGDSQHGDCRSEFIGSWWVKENHRVDASFMNGGKVE